MPIVRALVDDNDDCDEPEDACPPERDVGVVVIGTDTVLDATIKAVALAVEPLMVNVEVKDAGGVSTELREPVQLAPPSERTHSASSLHAYPNGQHVCSPASLLPHAGSAPVGFVVWTGAVGWAAASCPAMSQVMGRIVSQSSPSGQHTTVVSSARRTQVSGEGPRRRRRARRVCCARVDARTGFKYNKTRVKR